MEGNQENSSRPKSGNRANEKASKGVKSGNEKCVKWNRNLKIKPHQQNTWKRRKHLKY